MTRYDVTDEAIINAPSVRVYQAFVDEMDGRTTWWMPHHTFTLRSGASIAEVGALVESTVQSRWPVNYTTETVEVDAGERIRVKYVGGSFCGFADWTFQDTEGKTKIGCHWQTDPMGSLRFLARFLPVAKSHSQVTTAGFEKLEAYLN